MPHADGGDEGPAAKRQRLHTSPSDALQKSSGSVLFAPFRTVGLVSPTELPFTSIPLGKTTFQITTSTGRALQTYDLRRGLHLVFATRPQTPADITATVAWKEIVLAAWGGQSIGQPAGVWAFKRGKQVDELALPADLKQPIRKLIVFGSWIVACALTRIEVWKSSTLEHYTSIHIIATKKGDNELTGGIATMPTFLNKVFVGRKNGWLEIWNVCTGKLIYTILPPSSDYGAITHLAPSPALAFIAIAYATGQVILHDIQTDQAVLQLEAGNSDCPVHSISFRTDGLGAGHDGRKDGVMATATKLTGDVTFWDLNAGGRVMGVLRGAHNPQSGGGAGEKLVRAGGGGKIVRGGITRVEFLPGQAVMITSGGDNSLKSWIFDESSFSPVPRILHLRSGHASSVNCLHFLPSDFDGADAGNKWLLSGGQDRSLWGWSLRRDGQSTELSQGNIRRKAKKYGILSANALAPGQALSLEDIKAPEILCIASCLNRDGGIGALPGKLPIWKNAMGHQEPLDAEVSGMTGWESVVTAHRNDSCARTWFWGRKRAGRWALPTGDGTNVSTVALTFCGTFALVGSVGGSIDMYNLQSGQHRGRFPSRLTPAQARQRKMQQVRSADGVDQLAALTAVVKSSSTYAHGTGQHTAAVTGIIVDPINKYVISCGRDGVVKFWDFVGAHLLGQMDDWNGTAIERCCYHAANDLLAMAFADGRIRILDVVARRTIRELAGPANSLADRPQVTDFCFSHDGRWMIAAYGDAVIRVWDLPTSHLIDAIRLEKPCQALAMSAAGEYLATVVEGELGVGIWTNKSLFRHVPTRQVSEPAASAVTLAPTASGEGGQGLIEAAVGATEMVTAVATVDDEDADGTIAPSVDQLSTDMMTLSLVPRSRWQTLVHLDLIKQRNKPKEAPKLPDRAPFFLSSLPGQSLGTVLGAGQQDSPAGPEPVFQSRITKANLSRPVEMFTEKLRAGAASGNYDEFIQHLKSLAPSATDLELRSLSAGDDDDDEQGNELVQFVRALTGRLTARRDYELVQAWMTVFLRLHADDVLASAAVREALHEWSTHQQREAARLDQLVGYCSGIVRFLRDPRI